MPTLNIRYDTQTHVLCSVAESVILVRIPFFLHRLHVRNCIRIIEVSVNRGTDNRGRTVFRFILPPHEIKIVGKLAMKRGLSLASLSVQVFQQQYAIGESSMSKRSKTNTGKSLPCSDKLAFLPIFHPSVRDTLRVSTQGQNTNFPHSLKKIHTTQNM